MAAPIKHITIVGGGTAGWMAATLFNRIFNEGIAGADDPRRMRITLIESPDIPTVGVGEATVPAMPRFLRQVGISEQEFMRECNASYKLGVHFGRWNVDDDGTPYDFLNSFNSGNPIDGRPMAGYFLNFANNVSRAKAADDYVKALSPATELIKSFKGPKQAGKSEAVAWTPAPSGDRASSSAHARPAPDSGSAPGFQKWVTSWFTGT